LRKHDVIAWFARVKPPVGLPWSVTNDDRRQMTSTDDDERQQTTTTDARELNNTGPLHCV